MQGASVSCTEPNDPIDQAAMLKTEWILRIG